MIWSSTEVCKLSGKTDIELTGAILRSALADVRAGAGCLSGPARCFDDEDRNEAGFGGSRWWWWWLIHGLTICSSAMSGCSVWRHYGGKDPERCNNLRIRGWTESTVNRNTDITGETFPNPRMSWWSAMKVQRDLLACQRLGTCLDDLNDPKQPNIINDFKWWILWNHQFIGLLKCVPHSTFLVEWIKIIPSCLCWIDFPSFVP